MKQIIPEKKHRSKNMQRGAFVVVDLKRIYINNDSGKMLNPFNEDLWITIGIDEKNKLLTFSKVDEDTVGAFKMSRVKETEYARRIETNRALASIVRAGFPLGMLGKQLPASLLMDGSIMADYRFERQEKPQEVVFSA